MKRLSLGKRLRELRIAKGLSQVELARGICTPSMISQIESDRANPSYNILFAVAEKLDVATDKLLLESDLNLETISTFKMAKASVAAQDYMTAIPLFNALLQQRRSVISKAELLFDLAECYLHTGDYDKAESTLGEVLELALIRQDVLLVAKIYKNLGIIEHYKKRFHLAIYNWEKSLRYLETANLSDDFEQANLHSLIGDAYFAIGEVSRAIGHYDESTALFQRADNLDQMARMYMELGQAFQTVKNFEKAVEYSERAIVIFEGIDNIHMSVRNQVSSAIALAQNGQEKKALLLFEQSIRQLQELHKPVEVGIAYVELAKVQLLAGEHAHADESCQIASTLLPEHHVYQAWIDRVRADVELAKGNRKEAIYLKQLAGDQFKRFAQIGHWADTMTELSHLKVIDDDLCGAIHLLKFIRLETRKSLLERGIVL